MTPPLILRRDAAQACIDRFNGKPLDWGKVDCAKIGNHNLHKLGIRCRLLKGASYRSEAGAIRYLRSLGAKSMAEAIDLLGLQRIPPAMAVVADFVGLPVDGGEWDMALTIALGNGRVLGIHAGVCRPIQPTVAPLAAWRCDPCRK